MPPTAAQKKPTKRKPTKAPKKSPIVTTPPERSDTPAPQSKRGRPPGHAGGKRTDPEYKAALAYVRRDTHKRVMKRLRDANDELPDGVSSKVTSRRSRRPRAALFSIPNRGDKVVTKEAAAEKSPTKKPRKKLTFKQVKFVEGVLCQCNGAKVAR